jgi:hypothetical protein
MAGVVSFVSVECRWGGDVQSVERKQAAGISWGGFPMTDFVPGGFPVADFVPCFLSLTALLPNLSA